jgi:8-oxo-dGTP pyrophosphatase MutT (NUDIX family)
MIEKLFDMARKFADASTPLREAVCLCALKGDRVLAVARRGTKDEWGLPGGKVDPGENRIEALVREVREEANIRLNPNLLEPVFDRIDPPFFVTTFLYHGNVNEVPEQGDAGPVAWVTWEALLQGPFGQYNANLKHKLGL